jgi:nitrate/nitrite transporter NarK
MIFLIAPITFVMSLDRTAIAVAAPTIQHEYGFTLVEMSVILTSFSWTYAPLQVPGGWLAERFGPRRTLFWANAPWSALTAATPLGFNLISFVGSRALLGVGQAADWPSSIVAIRHWFPLSYGSLGIVLGVAWCFVIAALTLILAARAPGISIMMTLLCVSLASIGMTQVSIWPSTQDLGRGATGLVSGWTNFWGNAAGVAGPMLTALLVRWTGSWSSAMASIAIAGVAGAVLWLFVHPQRPLAALAQA